MNINKEIEVMVDVIGDTWLVDLEGSTMSVCEVLDEVDIESIARELVQVGYRNVKDKVVLDKEEWEVLHNEYAKSLYNARQQTRKETASDILQIIKREYDYIGDLEKIIAKKYGL